MAAQSMDCSISKYSLEYDFEELRGVTRGFAAENRLGFGACGEVFRGAQRDATEVAVKLLKIEADSGFEEEVRVLSKFRHPNLVILMGFARQGQQRALVYEFLGGGDVYARIAQSNAPSGRPFHWRARLCAARDAACGLSHLHNSRPRVFHRDIKSPNILLDSNGTAKMADFGLACLSFLPSHAVKEKSGTVGYACPHYGRTGVITEASEVYSFGMVLLEMLTAAPAAWPTSATPEGKQTYDFLVLHINGNVQAALQLSDSSAQWPLSTAQSLAQLALRCTTAISEERPDFVQVVHALREMLQTKSAEQVPVHTRVASGIPAQAAGPSVAAYIAPQLLGDGLPGGADSAARRALVAEWPQPVPAPPPAGNALPLLWSLECTFVEGLGDITDLPRERRVLAHTGPFAGQELRPMIVGRACLEKLLGSFDLGKAIVSAISDAHIQIRAHVAEAGEAATRVPCDFTITNLGINRIMVNLNALDSPGASTPLRKGDMVSLGCSEAVGNAAPQSKGTVQFRFDLTGSALRGSGLANSPSIVAGLPAPLQALTLPESVGTSLAGDVEPMFLLRPSGGGLRPLAAGAADMRHIVHGPLRESVSVAKGRQDTFPALMVGRGTAREFWQGLLIDTVYAALSREHLLFEACISCQTGEPTGICVKNLSSINPIRVSSSAEDAALDAAEPLAVGQRRRLRHGDYILVIEFKRTKEKLLVLQFEDLRAAAQEHDSACARTGGA